ncbi:MAG: phosphoribosylformylglycinamidine synthase subunit PurS [Lentisphaeria bacterium]|nr:phosphoribosylformylglycinamidine synthase subunit PurS [Lentisphaeria bacterium]
MDFRIEISVKSRWSDSRGQSVMRTIKNFTGLDVIEDLRTRDVFTVSADITAEEAEKIARELTNPVTQEYVIGTSIPEFQYDFLAAVGFRPGVTDNVARTAHEAIGDIIGRKLRKDEQVFSSVEYLFKAPSLTQDKLLEIARSVLANELIESVKVLSAEEVRTNGIPLNKPEVKGTESGVVREFDLEVSDEQLLEISRKGILALTLEEMKVIQNYYRQLSGREKYGLANRPTDVELEVLAQTWSEHCKHKIFDAIVDYEDTETGKKEKIVSLFKSYIKKSTSEIAKNTDWLVSVFGDNAGVIAFNDKIDLAYKVETHNSPSALDPYGGAMTGIVGVNRDPMGTGLGANLLVNVWGYCLGSPFTAPEDVPEGLLHPRRLRDGVHKGVIDGGNQSGIPYGLGWEVFDERYIGKPLVYCGTLGTIPKKINGKNGWEKSIEPGDIIVMTGGRIGKDGIHGATFSSEELHKDSPVQAVQIGDPITQKRMGDFIYEARDLGLYRFVTDNGAGGLSSSVGEMASICNGCVMDLQKAPLKYAGMQPWEILISEAQERMSFAVPPENLDEFLKLAADRDVEATVLGEFTNDGKFRMMWGDKTVCCLDIEFMHEGLPRLTLPAKWKTPQFEEPSLEGRDAAKDLIEMLGRLNICSAEYKARQYDHEVKGLSVQKPYIGKERDVQNDATVFMIEPLSREGVVLSSGILPRYSDIDTYHMMASVIDLAIRRIVAAGGRVDHIAGLDNFCWPDPVQSEKTPDGEYKMAQLVRANKALYDYTCAFGVPCISGKDSMKNDSTRGGRKISIPPTVLFSTISKIDDIADSLSPDFKFAGDDIYVIGKTSAELGGSEYFNMLGATGNKVPKVDAAKALALYRAMEKVIKAGLLTSAATPALGGIGVAAAKSAMAGRLGMELDLTKVPHTAGMSDIEILFSESNTRFIVSCKPENSAALEKALEGFTFAKVGTVDDSGILNVKGTQNDFSIDIETMVDSYKSTLAGV